VIAILLALGLALLVDDGAYSVAGLPLLAALALFGFAVQWLVFVPSFLRQTEHYYDLTGALTYASAILLAAGLSSPDARGWVITMLVLIWCGRLGSFLFLRVKRSGKDGRFDTLKPYWSRFFMAWTL
jgi:steroid 5-alpha reductase family enzyme